MKNVTMTEIKHFENRLEVLNELGIEVGLDSILSKRFERGLPNDLENAL